MTVGAASAPPASERLAALPELLAEQTDFARIVAALDRGEPATMEGVWGSACALAAAAIKRSSASTLLVVCPTADFADDLIDDLDLFAERAGERFPAWEAMRGERIIHDETFGGRLRLLKEALSPHPPAIVAAPIQALLQPCPSREQLSAGSRTIRIGERLDESLDAFVRWLTKHGFHATSAVELPGEFSHRGGILDVFAADWSQPVRIELFDADVESMRLFDVESQRSLERLSEIEITVVSPDESTGGKLADFLPHGSRVLLIDPEQIAADAGRYLERVEDASEHFGLGDALASLSKFPTVSAASLLAGGVEASCRLNIETVDRFSGELGMVKRELERVAGEDEVIVVAPTEADVERLTELLADTDAAIAGRLQFTVGRLRDGFRLVEQRLLVISGGEMFGKTDLRRLPRRHLGKAIDTFLDLRLGDLVVHLAHGIGRYRGVHRLDKEGRVEEHLQIEFAGGTKIFVPASKIGLVQKYVGGTKRRPKLATIGGKSWLRQKQAAEAAVTDLAAEMLEMQAERMNRPGIAFSHQSDWQREFEASFPYTETPDQLTAAAAIKSDMHTARPMDRLLCGDVGFGKTELAMRAAFKVVENGYQAAVLVPTTILAEQHYRSFSERMAEFPLSIERLSRFCTPAEQREVVAGLKAGHVNIVIGTHRLASRDVEFCNLGLVVIDEEQRFGVEVKERLKTLRATVNVLTMSATPIPRTLHMSLVGVRDISNLETAPEDRMAIETRVTRFDETLIRHAVMRELARGGQIFFVHNRVNDIEALAVKLRRIVPEASIRIGHGQMAEGELERVMVDFVAHKFDMLLATTIVESGLDIPNANTIFVDEANRYGLADLHQLRGRVGRYKHRAYAYFLIDPHKHLTPNAARRLRAIEEFSEMGAGFSIAMRDLEIRGAGNLLGTQQSGHIATVGYELYCQLLETAVARMKNLPPKATIDAEINLPGEAYLPDEYVGDMRMKIDLYRRLVRVTGFSDLTDFREELLDRFGPPPPPVKRMLSLAELRIDAAVWQVEAIEFEDRYLVFHYTHRGRIEQLAKQTRGRLRVVDDKSAYVTLKEGVVSPDALIAAAKAVLRSGDP